MLTILDVDHTLLKTNISFAFGKELKKQGVISLSQAIMAGLFYVLHTMHLISQETLHKAIFRRLFLGASKEKLQKLFAAFFAEQKERLVRKELLASLQGNPLILYSSSPDWIVEEVGRAFAIKDTRGTEYITDREGCFSKLGMVLTGENKARLALQEKTKREGPLSVYTDSADDIPLLNIADVAVAVCPDRALFRYAQKKRWLIIES